MNTHRYDEEQRRIWIRQKLTGAKTVKQICQEAHISRATLYNWMKEYPAEAGKGILNNNLRQLDPGSPVEITDVIIPASKDTGSRYRMLSAALKTVDEDGTMTRKMVSVLVKRFTITVEQACDIVGIKPAEYGYRPRKPEVEDHLVAGEIIRLLDEDGTRSYIDCYEILRKLYPEWTRKQIKRVYREERLYLKRSRAKKGVNPYIKGNYKEEDGFAVDAGAAQTVDASAQYRRSEASWQLGMIEGGFLNHTEDREGWSVLFILDGDNNLFLNAVALTGSIINEDVLSFLSRAGTENGWARKLKVPARDPFDLRELTRWAWANKMALHTLSMAKPENQEAVELMEEVVRRRIAGTGVSAMQDLQNAIQGWLSESIDVNL